eukprot:gene29483-35583_t
MGGEIKTMLAKDVTHYICSNVDDRDTLAAQLMNIHVVSPLWISQCMDSEQRVPEKDFAVSTELLQRVEEWLGPGRYQLADRPPRLSEPIPNRALRGRSLDSPSLSSSQRYRSVEENVSEPPLSPPKLPNPVAQPSLRRTIQTPQDASITEVPMYRPRPHPLSKAVSSKIDLSVRRSERILDLSDGESSSEEEEEMNKIEWVMGLLGPRHRPVPYIRLREEAAEDDEHMHKLFPTFFTAAGARKDIKLMSIQSHEEGAGDAEWIHGSLRLAVPVRDLPATIASLTAEEAATAERNHHIQMEKQKSKSSSSAKKPALKQKDTTPEPAAAVHRTPVRKAAALAPSSPASAPFSPSPTSSPTRGGRKKSTGESSPSAAPVGTSDRGNRRASRGGSQREDVETEEPSSGKVVGKRGKQPVPDLKLKLPHRGAMLGLYGSSAADGDDSESYLRDVVKAVIKLVQNKKNGKSKVADAEDIPLVALQSHDIREGKAKFTHLIIAQNTSKRPLCAIVAMARGLPILTSQYLLDSLTEERWIEDFSSYRFPRYAHLPLQASNVLEKKIVMFLKSTSPDVDVYRDILVTCGAGLIDSTRIILEEPVNYIAIGSDDQDFDVWIKENLQRGPKGRGEVEGLRTLLENNVPLVNSKFFFNCIEKNETYTPVEVGEVMEKNSAISRLDQIVGDHGKRGLKRTANVTPLDEGNDDGQMARINAISGKRTRNTCTPQLLLQSPSPSTEDAQKMQVAAGSNGDNVPHGFFGGLVSAVSSILSNLSPVAASAAPIPPQRAPLLAALGSNLREEFQSAGSRGSGFKRMRSTGSEPPSTQQAASSLVALSLGKGRNKTKSHEADDDDGLVDSSDGSNSCEDIDDVSEVGEHDEYERIMSKPKNQVVASSSNPLHQRRVKRNSSNIGQLQTNRLNKLRKK